MLTTFLDEYVPSLRAYAAAHVVLLIDFDDRVDERRAEFEQAIPDDLKGRVFVVGSLHTPERLKQALGMSFEEIGQSLASDCTDGTTAIWGHEQLIHNDSERERLVQTVKPFLF